MGVRHIALFRFGEGTTDEDVTAIAEALSGLPDEIRQLRAYRFGRDLGLSEGTWDYAVVADFGDLRAYEAYRDHPTHRRIIDELISPHITERAATQIEI